MASYHKRDVNFVAPAPNPRVEIVEVSPAQLPAPPQTVLLPTANYTDRARGFTLATGPLAAATGFVVALIAITAFGVPALSVAALLLALAGFTAAWLIAYIAHTLISPDGALFVHTILAWQFLRAEQKERHRRYLSVRTDKGGRHE
jgi:hypothetical protein